MNDMSVLFCDEVEGLSKDHRMAKVTEVADSLAHEVGYIEIFTCDRAPVPAVTHFPFPFSLEGLIISIPLSRAFPSRFQP